MVDTRFFGEAKVTKLGNLLSAVGLAAEAKGTHFQDMDVGGVDSLETAQGQHISLAAQKYYLSDLKETKAGVVLVAKEFKDDVPSGAIAIVCAEPHASFVKIIEYLYPDSQHRLAVIPHVEELGDAVLEDNVTIGQNAVLGSGAQIGKNTIIGPNTIVGPNVCIGRDCVIGANVTLECTLLGDNVIIGHGARIGFAGFGWLDHAKTNKKIPQVGRVILQAQTDIGPNVCIDRGALGDTIIGENTKLGALTMIGHNSVIGRNCLLAPVAGLAGGAILEDSVLIGANGGTAGHLTIGAGSIIFARSSASKSWPAGSKLVGNPAQDMKDFWRELAALRRLAKGKTK